MPGLSPRLRGNLYLDSCSSICLRSIPAPAGEPREPATETTSPRVYPRACGGTSSIASARFHPSRVYPRACGGTPGTVAGVWVYPRACGGTGSPYACGDCGHWQGLYPRACGGTPRSGHVAAAGISIPAPAGEPCGGRLTYEQGRSIPAPAGEPVLGPLKSRSIPAPAGEPLPVRGARGEYGSIPAPAGEPLPSATSVGGLSPRLRGNRR